MSPQGGFQRRRSQADDTAKKHLKLTHVHFIIITLSLSFALLSTFASLSLIFFLPLFVHARSTMKTKGKIIKNNAQSVVASKPDREEEKSKRKVKSEKRQEEVEDNLTLDDVLHFGGSKVSGKEEKENFGR